MQDMVISIKSGPEKVLKAKLIGSFHEMKSIYNSLPKKYFKTLILLGADLISL